MHFESKHHNGEFKREKNTHTITTWTAISETFNMQKYNKVETIYTQYTWRTEYMNNIETRACAHFVPGSIVIIFLKVRTRRRVMSYVTADKKSS